MTRNTTLNEEDVKSLFGARVKWYRDQRAWSITALADKAGVSQPYLSQIERGQKYPSLEKANAIASALEVELGDLLAKASDLRLKNMLEAIQSDDMEHFPLKWFGLKPQDILNLFVENPQGADGLFFVFQDLLRLHDISKQDIVHAAIRAYRRMNPRFLLQLEDEAKKVRIDNGWEADEAIDHAKVRGLLEERGYIIKENVLGEYGLGSVRFVYVQDYDENRQPLLYIAPGLTNEQKAFLFSYELYHAQHNIYQSESRRVDHLRIPDSVEAALNDYKAKYFAEALMVDQDVLKKGLENLFSRESWSEQAFMKLGEGASFGVFMHRVAIIASKYFGLNNASLVRFKHDLSHADGSFDVEREDNGAEHLPDFFAYRSEHFCRRFAAIKALRELHEKMLQGNAPPYVLRVHKSNYVGRFEGQKSPEYFVIAVAYPRHEAFHLAYSLMFEVDPQFKKKVAFWNDKAIDVEYVAMSCERCRLDGVEKETNPLKHCESRARLGEPDYDMSPGDDEPTFVDNPIHRTKSKAYAVKQFIQNNSFHRKIRDQHSVEGAFQ